MHRLILALASFAVIAGCMLGLVLFALGQAELDVVAKDIRIEQVKDQHLMCVDDLMEAKRAKYQCKRRRK
jgi:hypothetical protein